jgi:hypothetical protein
MTNEEEVEIVEIVPEEPVEIADVETSTLDMVQALQEIAEEGGYQIEVEDYTKSKTPPSSDPVQAFAQAAWEGEVPTISDVVHLSSLVYEADSRNSLSVAQVQIQLGILGYSDSSRDPLGWFSEGTLKALRDFKSSPEATPKSVADRATIELLFASTKVRVED